jgi:single-strand DNA-binding protein
MNVVILSGHLGQDPELKYTQGGAAVLRLRVATNDRTKRNGEWQDETTWHTVTCFGNRAEGLNRLLSKGKRVGVRGRLQIRSYEDRSGNKRTSVEVLADDVELQDRPENGAGGGQRQPAGGSGADDPARDFGDDDIPF